MKSKLMVTAVAVVGVLAISAPVASAATAGSCGEKTSQARDYSGSPDPTASNYNSHYGQVTGTDTLQTLPDGGTVYGDASQTGPSGYIGVTGSHGFLDLSGSQSSGITVQGYQTESGVNGKATVGTSPSVCLAGTKVV